VLGVNILPSQVEQANAFVRESGVADRVRFVAADYIAVPEPDGAVDIVWALESLAHGPDKQAFFDEAFRLLRPGGRVVTAETFLRSDPPLTPTEQADVDLWARGMAVPYFLSDRQCTEMMAQAGFCDIQLHDFTNNVQRSFARLSLLLKLTTPVQWLRTLTGRNDSIRLLNKRASAACCRGLKCGSWRYLAITARKPQD
jgi:cyclopropane fatty-acyl-phospholipid synthase-like methyltransferase